MTTLVCCFFVLQDDFGSQDNIYNLDKKTIELLNGLISAQEKLNQSLAHNHKKLDENVTKLMSDGQKVGVLETIVKSGALLKSDWSHFESLLKQLKSEDKKSIDLKKIKLFEPKSALKKGILQRQLVFGTLGNYLKNGQYLTQSQIQELQTIVKR